MPVAETCDAAPCADSGRAVPVHAFVPETLHLHHFRPTLARVFLEVGQHIDDVLLRCVGFFRVPRSWNDPVQSRGTRDAELKPEARSHRPCTRLHHHLGNVPERLNFDHLAFFKPVKLVEPHMGQVPGRRNVQPRTDEGTDIVPAAANPVATMFVRSAHDDPVPAFEVRHGIKEWRIAGVIERVRPGEVAERVRHVDNRVFGDHIAQRSADGPGIKIHHRSPERREGPLVLSMLVGHGLLLLNGPGPPRALRRPGTSLTLPPCHRLRSARRSDARGCCTARHDRRSPPACRAASRIRRSSPPPRL